VRDLHFHVVLSSYTFSIITLSMDASSMGEKDVLQGPLLLACIVR